MNKNKVIICNCVYAAPCIINSLAFFQHPYKLIIYDINWYIFDNLLETIHVYLGEDLKKILTFCSSKIIP